MRSLRQPLFLALPALLFPLAAACGSSSSSGSGGAAGGPVQSTTDGVTSGGMTTGSMTSTGSGNPGGPAVSFAIRKLFLGDTNRDGSPNKQNGWKQYGFNLDGKVSTATSTDLCQPRSGSSASEVYPDGNNGIDNSFGKNVLNILVGAIPELTTQENAGLAAGGATAIFSLVGLGAGADQASLPGRAVTGAALGQPPVFDGSQSWPVEPESLSNTSDPTSAKITFDMGSLSSSSWLGHAASDLVIDVQAGKVPLRLVITHAIVSMQLDATHQNASGTIGGILDVDAFTADLQKTFGGFDKSLCSGPTVNAIISQIQGTCDALTSGFQDPNTECSGITIGLGFEAGLVKLGPVAPPTQVPPDPCAP